jgi:hypothetical protein
VRAEREAVADDIGDRLFADVHPKARACFEDTATQVAGFCTRRSGKSRSAVRKLLRSALEIEHGRVFYINETRAECERIAWIGNARDGLLSVNDDFKLGGEPNISKLRLSFPAHHSFIELVGADDERGVRKLLGTAPHLVIIDEAQKLPHLRLLIRDVLGAALMDHQGQVILIGTPSRDLVGLFYDVTKPDTELDGWSVHTWSVLDNPFFGATEEERWERTAVEYCKRHSLSFDHPSVRRDWGPEWVKEDARYVYAVHEVPEHRLCYAPPRVRADGLPDLPRALADLPALAKGETEWQFTLFADLGFFPDPFAYVLWAWSWKDENLYEVCSWKKNRLDADQQLAEMRWVAEQVDVQLAGGDIGGAMTPTGKGWSKRWMERFGRELIEAEKNRKYEHIELFNTDIRRGKVKLRKGGLLHTEMKAVLWLPAPADELVLRKLREDPRIPNDVCDAALYGHRHTMQHLARTPEPPRPLVGTPEYFAALEQRIEDEETADDDGERDSYYSIQ